MLLSSVASAALLAPHDLPADSTVVKTVTTRVEQRAGCHCLSGPTFVFAKGDYN